MKQFKKMLITFVFVLCLSFCSNVSAKNIFGVLKCKYKVGDYSSKIDSSWIKDGYIEFYYTDLAFTYDYIEKNVLTKNSSNTIVPITNDQLKKFTDTYKYDRTKKNTMKDLNASFIQEIQKKGDCPAYFVVEIVKEKANINNNKHALSFVSDLTSKCGEDSKKCPIILRFEPAASVVKKSEKYSWEFKYNGEEFCKDLTVNIYTDDEAKLQASITYPSSSPLYSTNIKSALEAPVAVGNQFEYITNLVENNKLNGYVNLKDDKKTLSLKSSTPEASCTLNTGGVSNPPSDDKDPVGNCEIDLNKYSADIKTAKTEFDEYKKIISSARNNYLYESNISNFTPKDFSTYTDVEKLKDISSKIMKANEDANAKISAVDNYAKALNGFSEQNLCDDAKNTLIKDMNTFETDKELIIKHSAELTKALNTIADRLGELGEEEEKKKIEEHLDEVDISDKIGKTTPVKKPVDAPDVSLGYKKGCGVFSNEIKSWLIQVLDIVKIGALLLTLIFGMLDFFKGIAAGKPDAMKKMWDNFSKRLIAVVILFLLPVMIEFLLGLVTISGIDAANPLCGIK